MEVGRVADMEEDKMANMVVGMVADKRRRGKSDQHGVGHAGRHDMLAHLLSLASLVLLWLINDHGCH